jgi:hypothetical protein
MSLRIAAFALVTGLLLAPVPTRAEDKSDLTLQGEITGKDNHTYKNVTFDVPAGVTRITIAFEATGKEDHTTIDLGLLGPDGFKGQDGFRGWAGGSKRVFTVSASDATAAFLPGAIRPGKWTLLLGIPNIRAKAHASYTAKVWFSRDAATAWGPDVLNPPLRQAPGWYRGDLHMHTAHSDGSCLSQGNHVKVPCPLFLTVEAATKRKLDFIAISDHNTSSHLSDIRELQPYFDNLLLIPGRELTTFQGHANLWGVPTSVDFRVGSKTVPDWNALLKSVAPLHGVLSINHAIRPSGEECMGCGWTPDPPVDMHLVQAIEAVNGTDSVRPDSGIPFWEKQLAQGFRPTAVGGSDNHRAVPILTEPDIPVGTPTTVVHATALSMPAILDGIRAGHVFIDTEGTADRMINLEATVGPNKAGMGDELKADSGSDISVQASMKAPAGSKLVVLLDGKPLADAGTSGATIATHLSGDGKPHWLRAEVRATDGRLLLLGNPVYLNRLQR